VRICRKIAAKLARIRRKKSEFSQCFQGFVKNILTLFLNFVKRILSLSQHAALDNFAACGQNTKKRRGK
jgi:hypothetical protein